MLDVRVISSPDPRRGETVKALVVLRGAYKGKVAPEEMEKDIITWAKGEMAAYKHPRSAEFVDTLPKSGAGQDAGRYTPYAKRLVETDARAFAKS